MSLLSLLISIRSFFFWGCGEQMSTFSWWSTSHRPREVTRIHLGEPGGEGGLSEHGGGVENLKG